MTKDEALKFSVKALLPLIKRAAPYGEDDWLDGKEAVEKCNSALAQPAQELQVRTGDCLLVGVCASEGHKIQAKRPWVGLTEEEMLDIERNTTCEANESWLRNVTCNIEDALRRKNT